MHAFLRQCDSGSSNGQDDLGRTFSGAAATTFPSPPIDLHIYVQVTSFVGQTEFRLACLRIDLAEPEEVYSASYPVEFRGKLHVEQLHLALRRFQFPSAGEYAFQLWCQGQYLAERRLGVRGKGDEA
ncbi:MAG: hypothetical protein LC808_37645 [Actinobacteria bacterium]|nr:hypothetical protein [Actinomycetota bacterium]